jgi:thioester reductase-like protein
VQKVYCLVRAPTKVSARSRVRDSLRERLAYHKLSLSMRSKIVALPSDFSDAHLGLDESDYGEISGSITHLIHLAWSVNFNKALESFEADCIAGAKNLMNLCLSAKRPEPASFNFCSSVSVTAATPGNVVPEALPESLSYAQNMGYAQSKLVTEHLARLVSRLESSELVRSSATPSMACGMQLKRSRLCSRLQGPLALYLNWMRTHTGCQSTWLPRHVQRSHALEQEAV